VRKFVSSKGNSRQATTIFDQANDLMEGILEAIVIDNKEDEM